MVLSDFLQHIIVVLPALALCIYVYKKDKLDREPSKLLFTLFITGFLIGIPVSFAERFVLKFINRIFAADFFISSEGMKVYISQEKSILIELLIAFVGVAILEELSKWVCLIILTNKNKNFDYYFDGIVYSVFLGLGYALVDSLFLSFTNGWRLIVFRTASSLTNHIIFAVIMGVIYTEWHARKLARSMEKEKLISGELKESGIMSPVLLLLLSLILPVLIHGSFVYVDRNDSTISGILYYSLSILIYVIFFIIVFISSKKDIKQSESAMALINKKHPELTTGDE